MAKKDKVQFQNSDDLDSVDVELAEAMERLDETNTRVVEVLRTYEPPPPESASPQAGDVPSPSADALAAEPAG
jgi:hypothetical protein